MTGSTCSVPPLTHSQFALALALGCAAPPVLTPTADAPVRPIHQTSATTASEREEPQLQLIDDYNPPRSAPTEVIEAPGARWDAALGGLSGLHYDRASATLYAISDLPRRFDPRLYTFSVQLTDTALHVEPKAVFSIHARDPAEHDTIKWLDAESITSNGHGAFFVGTENGADRPDPPPRIRRMDAEGLLTDELALPEDFLAAPAGSAERGPRSNRAFEGLALSPSGRWLTAGLESPLYQDGDDATFDHGAKVRLLRWDTTTFAEPAQYFYPLEPMDRPASGTPTGGNNGVSELVSLDDRRLWVLERGYVPLQEGPGPTTVRIFEVTLPDVPAPPQQPELLSKRLVLDLGDITSALEPGAQTLDNLEGMTLGPELPSGDQSLLLVSDDNFRADQRTVFLAFRVRRAPTAR